MKKLTFLIALLLVSFLFVYPGFALSTCGGSGQPCCSGNTCNSALICTSGMCQASTCICGTWTNVPCGGSCPSTQRQQTRTCRPSGCNVTSQCVADSSCVPTCACGTWTNGACGGSCPSNQRQQTRTCTPTGCSPSDGLGTSRCVADTSCLPFTFSLSLNPTADNAFVGNPFSITVTINVTRTGGTAQIVNFAMSGTIPGTTIYLPQSCTPNPTCTSTFTISGTPSVTGSYQIGVTGAATGANEQLAVYTLTITRAGGGCTRCYLMAIGPYILEVDPVPVMYSISVILVIIEVIVVMTIFKRLHKNSKKKR